MCREKKEKVCSLLTSHSLFQVISRDVKQCKGRLHIFTSILGAMLQADSSPETLLLKNQFWSIGVKSLQWYKWEKRLAYFLSTTFLRRLINCLIDNPLKLQPFVFHHLVPVLDSYTTTKVTPVKTGAMKCWTAVTKSMTQVWMWWPRRGTISLALHEGTNKLDFCSRLLCALRNIIHCITKGGSQT